MKTLLYIFLVLLVILWAFGYFVFSLNSKIHLLLVFAVIILIVIGKKIPNF
ncbi:lmo0937 family membrane protein [Winogradskyella undariae]|uniref:lmo0937 family membrane protein n=1 Tax=Winogradskyella TaxID=286104 RepID=UPI00156BB903|nr:MULTISPECIES: lmo0937 family membrane protein [Winogradskyella]NRR92825.1 lmo0937 family membrane protein [Winogradskyella undariae]QXP79861.1 lmo0937 family membrane protein [Winogradskyella sp. HaHa_3_26]